MKQYPDVTELLRQKAQRRQRLARLSFEEKIAVVNKWRKLTRSIRNNQNAPRQSMGGMGAVKEERQNMNESLGKHYLDDSIGSFRSYKKMADRALAQLKDEEYFITLDEEANSIAVIMKHIAGNMFSRWTDFLTTDGEKPDRNRDMEFVIEPKTGKEDVVAYWEQGWQRVFDALEPLGAADLEKKVLIRGEEHTVVQAINRQLMHYSYHIGQMVFLAKHFRSAEWNSLSIPRNRSAEFNAHLQNQPGAGNSEERLDEVLKFVQNSKEAKQ